MMIVHQWKVMNFTIEVYYFKGEDEAKVFILNPDGSLDSDNKKSSDKFKLVRALSKIWNAEVIPFLKEEGIASVICSPTTESRWKLYKRFSFVRSGKQKMKLKL